MDRLFAAVAVLVLFGGSAMSTPRPQSAMNARLFTNHLIGVRGARAEFLYRVPWQASDGDATMGSR
jgi:hypothetical protein